MCPFPLDRSPFGWFGDLCRSFMQPSGVIDWTHQSRLIGRSGCRTHSYSGCGSAEDLWAQLPGTTCGHRAQRYNRAQLYATPHRRHRLYHHQPPTTSLHTSTTACYHTTNTACSTTSPPAATAHHTQSPTLLLDAGIVVNFVYAATAEEARSCLTGGTLALGRSPSGSSGIRRLGS